MKRLRLLGGVLVLLVSVLSCEAQAAAAEPSKESREAGFYASAALRPAGMTSVRWTKGFWADRYALCRDTVVPEMKKALLASENTARLVNFRIAAGLEKGSHQGTDWSDGDCYKWIEAMAWLYAINRDPGLDREMDAWIELIAKTQAPDGYISTQVQLDPTKKRWENLHHHELYNMGHLLTAASVHAQATGKGNFLGVARKVADYLDGVFSPRPPELAHMDFNPSHIMGLMDLYRATGEVALPKAGRRLYHHARLTARTAPAAEEFTERSGGSNAGSRAASPRDAGRGPCGYGRVPLLRRRRSGGRDR